MRISLVLLLLGVAGVFGLQTWVADSPDTFTPEVFLHPEQVRLECPFRDCPGGVGVLMTQIQNSRAVLKCVATLIDPSHILTAAKCLGSESASGRFFYLRGAETAFTRINAVSFNSSPQAQGKWGYAMDWAILELDRAIEGGDLHPPARELDEQELYAVTAVARHGTQQFSLVRKACKKLSTDDQAVDRAMMLHECEVGDADLGSPVLVADGRLDALISASVDPEGEYFRSWAAQAGAKDVPSYPHRFTLAYRLNSSEFPEHALSPALYRSSVLTK